MLFHKVLLSVSADFLVVLFLSFVLFSQVGLVWRTYPRMLFHKVLFSVSADFLVVLFLSFVLFSQVGLD